MVWTQFRTTLTGFYRANTEVQAIGEQLLQWQLPELSSAQRAAMIRNLLTGYHSHHYALSGQEMQHLGFKVKRDPELEALLWRLSLPLQQSVGAGTRQSADDAWIDAALISLDRTYLRVNKSDQLKSVWQQE